MSPFAFKITSENLNFCVLIFAHLLQLNLYHLLSLLGCKDIFCSPTYWARSLHSILLWHLCFFLLRRPCCPIFPMLSPGQFAGSLRSQLPPQGRLSGSSSLGWESHLVPAHQVFEPFLIFPCLFTYPLTPRPVVLRLVCTFRITWGHFIAPHIHTPDWWNHNLWGWHSSSSIF